MEKWEREEVKKRQENEFYITPQGKIVKWWGSLEELDEWASTHSLIASKLLPQIKDGRAGDALHKMGWISYGSPVYGIRISCEPTQSQINILFDLGYNQITDDVGKKYKW
jgi:hypothetical protein